eukprot:Clim_evm41s157 gene=Clim_evmTU41s157
MTLPAQNICSGCEKDAGDLKRCAACHSAAYCSKDCQKQHWTFHKKVCKRCIDPEAVKNGSLELKETNRVWQELRAYAIEVQGLQEMLPDKASHDRYNMAENYVSKPVTPATHIFQTDMCGSCGQHVEPLDLVAENRMRGYLLYGACPTCSVPQMG